jgi:hypothetical protein
MDLVREHVLTSAGHGRALERCLVRRYEARGCLPVVIVEVLDRERPGLAAQLELVALRIARLWFEDGREFRLIEHRPGGDDEFAELDVTWVDPPGGATWRGFASYPLAERRSLARAEVERLVGHRVEAAAGTRPPPAGNAQAPRHDGR